MKNRIRYIYINCFIQVILFFLLFAIDFFSKKIVLADLKEQVETVLINNVLSLCYVENTGAAFGLLKNSPLFFSIICSAVFVLICIIFILIFFSLKKYCTDITDKDYSNKTFNNMTFLEYILCVLAAGAAGNITDRVIYGHVIDFIKLDFISFPVFNIADIYVTSSVFFLLFFFIFIYREDKNFHIFRK